MPTKRQKKKAAAAEKEPATLPKGRSRAGRMAVVDGKAMPSGDGETATATPGDKPPRRTGTSGTTEEKKPAVAAPQNQNGDFDPEEVVKRFNCFRLNAPNGAYYWMQPGFKKVGTLARREFDRVAGLCTKLRDGEIETEAARVERYLILHRLVDVVVSGIGGCEAGCQRIQNRNVMVMLGPDLIEPVEGDFRLIQVLLAEMFQTFEGFKQVELFLGWLQRAFRAVRYRERTPGQALLLVGPPGIGKGVLQTYVVTPALGGRMADPLPMLLGETQFNSEVVAAEHLAISDAPHANRKEAQKIASRAKQMVANEYIRLHEKGVPAINVRPISRITWALNDDPDSLSVLPKFTPDTADKFILLKVSKPSCLPGSSEGERKAFRDQLEQELPAFLYWLEHNFEIPAAMKNDRYGVCSWHHPDVSAFLEEDSPDRLLFDMIEKCQPWLQGKDGVWFGKWESLRELLLTDGETADDMAKWVRHSNLSKSLGRLVKAHQGRFSYVRRSNGGNWRISGPERPAGEAKAAEPELE